MKEFFRKNIGPKISHKKRHERDTKSFVYETKGVLFRSGFARDSGLPRAWLELGLGFGLLSMDLVEVHKM